MQTSRLSLPERAASVSPGQSLALVFGWGAVMGAWQGSLYGSYIAVVTGAAILSLGGGLLTLVMLQMILRPLRRLVPSERRAIIDAVRFGRSVGDPRLVRPLLTYIDSREKLVTRSATNAAAAVLGLLGAAYAVDATQAASRGNVSETMFYACFGAVMMLAAAIWPAAGRASRRNVETARQAAHALQSEPSASAAGLIATIPLRRAR